MGTTTASYLFSIRKNRFAEYRRYEKLDKYPVRYDPMIEVSVHSDE